MPAVLSLVDSIGEADPEFEKAKPYLEAYDVIALGAGTSGERAKVRVAAGLK